MGVVFGNECRLGDLLGETGLEMKSAGDFTRHIPVPRPCGAAPSSLSKTADLQFCEPPTLHVHTAPEAGGLVPSARRRLARSGGASQTVGLLVSALTPRPGGSNSSWAEAVGAISLGTSLCLAPAGQRLRRCAKRLSCRFVNP